MKVVKKEALSLDSRFADMLNRRLHGRLDSRKEKEREQAAATKGTGGRGRGAAPATAAAAAKPPLAAPPTEVSDDDVPF